jgi:hypothetical protein
MRPYRHLGLIAVVALLAACEGGRPSVPTSALSSTPSSADSYAQQVLGEAPIPPGAHSTTAFHSDFLKQPFQSVATDGLVDIDRIYSIDQPPEVVQSYITSHLPRGASVQGTGTLGSPTGVAHGIEISIPTSGPNENYAELIYEVVSDAGQSSEFRVDAQVIWVADRSAEELAPSDAVVEVTGYSQISLANASSGPVTIKLTSTEAETLRTTTNSLPLGPRPFCMEDSLLYKIDFHPSTSPKQSFELDGYECGATVLVSSNGKALSPLSDAGCHLLAAVVSLLPNGQAGGTRSALGASCH